ncbi:MAG TPA: FAD-dependent oxidoreductase, partial [Polyangiaceae bacterium]|nr:FAD-dependent oxidoreductase [Polyangiaceae bacterium]
SQLGDRVSLFEAASRLGGQLHTEHASGFLIEHGAEGFVAGSEAVAELARSLGIAHELRDQLVRDSCRFDGSQLTRLEPGQAGRLLGFQVGARALGGGIQSFLSGMTGIVEALRAALPPEVACHLGCGIRRLERAAMGPGWLLWPATGEPPTAADAVVIATSAAGAARLLEGTFGAPAAALGESRALSSVTVSLAYERAHVAHALDATGFVVADEAQDEGFRACTFASSKLPGRAPASHALLRLFFRPTPQDLAERSDAEWIARAERCAGRALSLSAAAQHGWVSRWDQALPVFDAAHRARVQELEAALAGSGILLAGAAFHGSGIDGAVQSAAATTRTLSQVSG